MNELNVKPIIEWFEQAKPEPTIEDACVQVGCHYEEVTEMLDNLLCPDSATVMESLSNRFKGKKDHAIHSVVNVNKQMLLDDLCDQIVTAVGVAYMLGMDIQGALNEVNRSNWSKFVDGKAVFNEHGKIAKSENYTPPQLIEFVK